MNAIEKIRSAQSAAQAIINSFTASQPADVVETRKASLLEEVSSMNKADAIAHLVAKVVELEKPKAENKVKVEDVARALMESPECATLTWGDVADLICSAGLGEKTSQASISSYASKKKEEWNIVPREKMRFNASDLLAAVGQ